MSELRQQFLDGMSCVAATVTVVTTDGPSGRAGVTVSAMSSVSADTAKPTLLVCVNQASSGAAPILENGAFCVNILRDDQAVVSDTFAGRFGDKGEEKFGCGTWAKGRTGAPMLDDALVSFDCRLVDRRLVGSHHVLFGEVEEVRLSEPGRALVYANRAYGTLLSLKQRATVGQIDHEPIGIACLSSFAPFYLPGLLGQIHRADSDIAIDVREGDQAQVIEMLEAGEVDLALAYALQLPGSLNATPLAPLAPYVLLPDGHPLANQQAISLADLAAEPMILLDAPLSRDYFAGLFAKQGLVPNVAMRTPSFEMLRGLVANGLGYSLLVTRPASGTSYDGGRLVERPLAEEVEPIQIALLRRGGGQTSPEAQALVEQCKTWFGELADRVGQRRA